MWPHPSYQGPDWMLDCILPDLIKLSYKLVFTYLLKGIYPKGKYSEKGGKGDSAHAPPPDFLGTYINYSIIGSLFLFFSITLFNALLIFPNNLLPKFYKLFTGNFNL